MGLATSQVRLLALTSRKADVEMQIQLNSKRKTMLTREATQLSKLYYAKLQNSKIQYSTTNGYRDVTYNYLMGDKSTDFFRKVVNGTPDEDRKASNGMILTDSYGRVILNDNMLSIVINTLNDETVNTEDATVETLTINALEKLLEKLGSDSTASSMKTEFDALLNGRAFGAVNPENKALGMDVLKELLRNGFNYGGVVFMKTDEGSTKYYSSCDMRRGTEITLDKGKFYVLKDASFQIVGGGSADGNMYLGNVAGTNGYGFVTALTGYIAKQIANMMSYYGAIFSASFKGSTNISGEKVYHYNVAADITKNSDGKFEKNSNSVYDELIKGDNLQNGLKSGVYQLVNVTNNSTGSFATAQNLDYFVTQNLVVEKVDNSERESITAWYNAARADLEEKETYWDTEITQLSTELNTITTEIDSVKSLRKDAIDTTFKWGQA